MGGLPWSAVIPSVHRRRIDQAPPHCGWRAWLWRARSPRRYHTSSPVRVPRPAPSFHAAFRPHLTVPPWRFPCPSAPRTPGRETFTPEHDRMHGTHARGERRATRHRHPHGKKACRVARPLHCLVRLRAPCEPCRGAPAPSPLRPRRPPHVVPLCTSLVDHLVRQEEERWGNG
jgi:hypothetical protein